MESICDPRLVAEQTQIGPYLIYLSEDGKLTIESRSIQLHPHIYRVTLLTLESLVEEELKEDLLVDVSDLTSLVFGLFATSNQGEDILKKVISDFILEVRQKSAIQKENLGKSFKSIGLNVDFSHIKISNQRKYLKIRSRFLRVFKVGEVEITESLEELIKFFV